MSHLEKTSSDQLVDRTAKFSDQLVDRTAKLYIKGKSHDAPKNKGIDGPLAAIPSSSPAISANVKCSGRSLTLSSSRAAVQFAAFFILAGAFFAIE